MSNSAAGTSNSKADHDPLVRILGGLNFGDGAPDGGFRAAWNTLLTGQKPSQIWKQLPRQLYTRLEQLRGEQPAFQNSAQAERALHLVFERVWPAYWDFHVDLLAHLKKADLAQPFFVCVLCEETLAAMSRGLSDDEAVPAVLDALNDFLGHRPIAVLENGQQMQPYRHERHRPLPLFWRGVGAAAGPYQQLIEHAVAVLQSVPADFRLSAYLDLDCLDELALDLRAYDNTHPVLRRTNYLFGEWDPHSIGDDGRFHRFVVRKVMLDALLKWVGQNRRSVGEEEALYDAATALAGTLLMAASVSGAGPDTFDSNTSLSHLLGPIARARDAFYDQLMASASGARAERLKAKQKQTLQPFGHIRQFVNASLGELSARQIQHRTLALLYARMGFPEASRQEAGKIPAPSIRFESEIRWRFRSCETLLEQRQVGPARELLAETEALLFRGIECGAFVDPWNILGFQGQYALFVAREDAVPDTRCDVLIDLFQESFYLLSKTLAAAAIQGDVQTVEQTDLAFDRLASRWDRYGTQAVEEFQSVSGGELLESARSVAGLLAEWHAEGEEIGNLRFWHARLGRLQTAGAFAQLIGHLITREDHVAVTGLMMEWLSRAEELGLESGFESFSSLLLRWMDLVQKLVESESDPTNGFGIIRRLFDYLEANAGPLWRGPRLPHELREGEDNGADGFDLPGMSEEDLYFPNEEDGPLEFETGEAPDEEPVEEYLTELFSGMQFKDSEELDEGGLADSYNPGELTDIERLQRSTDVHMRFLRTLSALWIFAAERLLAAGKSPGAVPDETLAVIEQWYRRSRELQRELHLFVQDVVSYSVDALSDDPESFTEMDVQQQTKLYLLNMVSSTLLACQQAEWALATLLPVDRRAETRRAFKLDVVALYRALVVGDGDWIDEHLPGVLKRLRGLPLLYVPFEHGGEPRQVLAAHSLHMILRLLVTYLPAMGRHRETWHVHKTAWSMERESTPGRRLVTEFDRLFRVGLRSALWHIIVSSRSWRRGSFTSRELVQLIGEVLEHYAVLWSQHSTTMRLSSADVLLVENEWQDVERFIAAYGRLVFDTKSMTLGNLRSLARTGPDAFIAQLEQRFSLLPPEETANHRNLLSDLESGVITFEEVDESIGTILEVLVDKFERFNEYNSTTAHSDYGEKLISFLEFLRAEVAYDRDDWQVTPMRIAHEVLLEAGCIDAAAMWEDFLVERTAELGQAHERQLRRLERKHGMRLRSLADRLSERFVRPLVLHRLLSQVGPTMSAESEATRQERFASLRAGIESYGREAAGSVMEIPEWLHQLANEVAAHAHPVSESMEPVAGRGDSTRATTVTTDLKALRRQLEMWEQPLFLDSQGPDAGEVPARRPRGSAPDRRQRTLFTEDGEPAAAEQSAAEEEQSRFTQGPIEVDDVDLTDDDEDIRLTADDDDRDGESPGPKSADDDDDDDSVEF